MNTLGFGNSSKGSATGIEEEEAGVGVLLIPYMQHTVLGIADWIKG